MGRRWESLLKRLGLLARDAHVQESPAQDQVDKTEMIDVISNQADNESADPEPDPFSTKDIDIVRVRTLARRI